MPLNTSVFDSEIFMCIMTSVSRISVDVGPM